ncbi:MAG: hypothetical protein K2X27_16780 [Candidatus Obscuribacterales bacterium]|nr:hypothetical protein [Candidatus Obscuribacterales bacterium]
MKCNSKLLLAIVLLSATFASSNESAKGQQKVKRSDPNTYYRAPQTMAGKMIVLPIGTTFEGRLSSTLSSAKSHAGQSFSITLSAPVLANGIDVVIPAGSEVMGEVVEAISAGSQPRRKGFPKPRGKLRIQINQLRTPDGTAFPLVGNLVGEEEGKNGRGRSRLQTPLGSGVGFVGTSEAFEAVAPGSNRYGKQISQGRGPDYVKKREFLAHEIYGNGADQNNQIEDRRVRSLVLRKQDLWIDAGSPLTVKLQAPLRLSMSAHNSGAPVGAVDQDLGSDDSLPPPSMQGGGGEIPAITDDGAGANQAPPRRLAPAQTAPQPPQPGPAATPGATPSSDF